MHGPVGFAAAPTPDDAVDLSKSPWAVFYFVGVGQLTGGTVIAEEAPEKDTPGTWAPITGMSLTVSTLNGGGVAALHLPVGAYSWVRLRATAAVTGTGALTAIVESSQLW